MAWYRDAMARVSSVDPESRIKTGAFNPASEERVRSRWISSLYVRMTNEKSGDKCWRILN